MQIFSGSLEHIITMVVTKKMISITFTIELLGGSNISRNDEKQQVVMMIMSMNGHISIKRKTIG